MPSGKNKRPAIVWGDNLVPMDFEMVVGIPNIFRRYDIGVDLCMVEFPGNFDLHDPYGFKPELTSDYIYRMHDEGYLKILLTDKICPGEWNEPNLALTDAALGSVTSSLMGAELIATGAHDVVWAVASGQHHAKRASGGGFCALNDVAIAATYLADQGLKVAVIDIDGHAGDGTQEMLFDTDIATISIHQGNNFPMDPMVKSVERPGVRHTKWEKAKKVYNFNLEDGAGDVGLQHSLEMVRGILMDLKPDVIVFVGGADAAVGSPLVNLGYTMDGFDDAARQVSAWANEYCDGRVLMLSAGGYQPLDVTPRVWANMFQILAGLR